jgi:hypothetical protein
MALDLLDLMEGHGGKAGHPTMRARDNRDTLDEDEGGTLTAHPGNTPHNGSLAAMNTPVCCHRVMVTPCAIQMAERC